MKTINCTLPIYDSIIKQTYERSKKSITDKKVPVLCPRHRLPAFQWNNEDDAPGAPVKIELMDANNMSWPDISSNALNDTGGLWNDPFDTFGVFSHAIQAINSLGNLESCHIFLGIDVVKGDVIRVDFSLTLNSGQAPRVILVDVIGNQASSFKTSSAGPNTMYIYCNQDLSDARLRIFTTALSDFQTTAVIIHQGDITSHFVALPASSAFGTDTYYSYKGDTLNYLINAGDYYLKITTANDYVFYSDWFKVSCIYDNLITVFTNYDYNFLSVSGTAILAATESGASGNCFSNLFIIRNDESITIIFNLLITSGQLPTISLVSFPASTTVDSAVCAAGLNIISLTPGALLNTEYSIAFSNTAAATFSTSEVIAIRSYSDTHIRFNFSNTCDLGDIDYSDGFEQSLWFETEAMEPSFPIEDQGQNNGEGRFVRTFARQVKKYLIKTLEIPDFIVEVLHRMKMHNTVTLIDTVGNENSVYNIEVDTEWLYVDKYYAKCDITLDYDEAFVVYACCE